MFDNVTKKNVWLELSFRWVESTNYADAFRAYISDWPKCEAYVRDRDDGCLSFPLELTTDQRARFAVLIDELRQAAVDRLGSVG